MQTEPRLSAGYDGYCNCKEHCDGVERLVSRSTWYSHAAYRAKITQTFTEFIAGQRGLDNPAPARRHENSSSFLCKRERDHQGASGSTLARDSQEQVPKRRCMNNNYDVPNEGNKNSAERSAGIACEHETSNDDLNAAANDSSYEDSRDDRDAATGFQISTHQLQNSEQDFLGTQKHLSLRGGLKGNHASSYSELRIR
ncbi:hypothetical protein SCP_1502170 [Sparassis crispa]|uniref:Uncharacterized protein n=1 Tax=Sparassis crispa TaxID=139825 RepID=A0A401H499_9APHY|nr:hypothetical protein SCP_1502170 [Sparassis crispa]GBE89209.1 hypothetical protein SCP_1502170 [Sparassis crispa]